ncbi:MAG: HNH endonuclease [Bacillota bacterium]
MIYLNKWLKEIIKALNNLNGKGTLEQIYNQISTSKSIDLSSYTDWKSQVRKNIYLHSSDCDIFKGNPDDENDLFFSVEGKGEGIWGIRKINAQPSIFPFTLKQEYKRSDMHNSLGGNRQRGISSSKENPMIFIFSGKEGKAYGYEDGWQDGSTFFYTGEGQIGNQEFKEGNKALRDHLEKGKDVFLFEKNELTGLYTYEGQLTLMGYHFSEGPDKLGSKRSLIIFEFIRTENVTFQTEELDSIVDSDDIDELRRIATESASVNSFTVRDKKQVIRKRSGAIKKYALVRSKGDCEACGQIAPFHTIEGQPFLEVHHMYRLSDGGMDHPVNVAAICPNCHRRVHYGNDKAEYNNLLKMKIKEKEQKNVRK